MRHASVMTSLVMFALLVGTTCGGMAVNYERVDQRKQEIAMLWAQIREWRQDSGLRGVEPPAREILKMQGKPVALAISVCPARVEPRTPHCVDVCGLASSICENAQRICQLARELDSDDWADGKCASSTASCKESKQACCRCFRDETPPETPASEPNAPADAGFFSTRLR